MPNHWCATCNATRTWTKTGREKIILGKPYIEAKCDVCGKLLYFRKMVRTQKVWPK